MSEHEHSHKLADEIRDVLRLSEPGALADLSPLLIVTTWAEEIAEAAHAAAVAYESVDREQLVVATTEMALQVWDDQIVPQDIPGLPEPIEKLVESSIRSMIPSLVLSLFAKKAADSAE